MSAPHYAIVSFDTVAGPVKTGAHFARIDRHNNRTEQLAHVDPNAPEPIRLIGHADSVKAHRVRLAEHGIVKPRANAMLAWEAMFTSDFAYFRTAAGEIDWARIGAWATATAEFAIDHWGKHRVLSMTMHLDERTPHIHCTVVPLAWKEGGRFGDRWTLDRNSIAGPGCWQALQDGYAAAVKHLDLVRGRKLSGQRHRPYNEVLANLADQQERTAKAEEEAARLSAANLLLILATAAANRRATDLLTEAERIRSEADQYRSEAATLAQKRRKVIKAATEFQEALKRIPVSTMPRVIVDALRSAETLTNAVDDALAREGVDVADWKPKRGGPSR